ncbi:hypothetical protein GCE86_21335 [Micromonospora terminaliae]|uniref:Uncharacterized protein n=1 Tax=Micromonospora terminaliae TaxID=1914461 RepID=A0AAJ2ZK08_9ACTN|nr:hypothetical protein [Micromonospora terminaliae]NES31181.1 hypothetical protein [Micromonospora terminaliae]QGL49337.1 hypothetical protein GCE86_21335 [Micromonospora terminaliae]
MTGTGADSGAGPAMDPVPGAGPADPSAHHPLAQPPAFPPHPPAFPPQPPVPWAPPPGPRNRTFVVAAVIVGVVLLVGCLGLTGGVLLLRSATTTASGPAGEAPPAPVTGRSPAATAAPDASEEPVQEGPAASGYPAEEISDLNRVCDDDVYYPQSPKRAGKAPHPVVLLIGDGSGLRYQNGTYYFSQGLSKKVEQTWAAEAPTKVQMVACLDRVSSGAMIRRCKYDDPKPLTLTLLTASWRLRVYEVATGRKLLDKPMTGDDRACPYVVLAGPDKKIYAEVSDRAAVAALRKLVNGSA